MKVLMVFVLALMAIALADDVKKDKRSLNEHVGYQPISEGQAELDKAVMAQYAEALTGTKVIEQSVPAQNVQTVQVAQETLPVVQQTVQEALPIEQPALQYTHESLPIVQQTIPIQQEAIQNSPQSVEYAPQYAPEDIQYASQPIQYAPQTFQYASEAVPVHGAPVPTVERTIYKTTHIERLVPQPYPVEVVKHVTHPVIVDRPVPQPYPVKVAVPKPYPVYIKQRPSKTVILASNHGRNSNSIPNYLSRSDDGSYSPLIRSLFSLDDSTYPKYRTASTPEELLAIGNALGYIQNKTGFIVRRFKHKDI